VPLYGGLLRSLVRPARIARSDGPEVLSRGPDRASRDKTTIYALVVRVLCGVTCAIIDKRARVGSAVIVAVAVAKGKESAHCAHK
jgi:hypothetical protein